MPTTFKAGGHEWIVSINITAVKQVRQELKIDLAQLEPDVFLKLARDPVKLVDMLWVLCRKQAAELNITDEQFGEMMAGDIIYNATHAFLDEYVNFVPNPDHRKITMDSLEQMRRTEKAAMEKAARVMKHAAPAIEQELEKKIGEVLQT